MNIFLLFMLFVLVLVMILLVFFLFLCLCVFFISSLNLTFSNSLGSFIIVISCSSLFQQLVHRLFFSSFCLVNSNCKSLQNSFFSVKRSLFSSNSLTRSSKIFIFLLPDTYF